VTSIIHVVFVVNYDVVISFDDIQLMPQLRENLIEMGVISPTPIQMESVRVMG